MKYFNFKGHNISLKKINMLETVVGINPQTNLKNYSITVHGTKSKHILKQFDFAHEAEFIIEELGKSFNQNSTLYANVNNEFLINIDNVLGLRLLRNSKNTLFTVELTFNNGEVFSLYTGTDESFALSLMKSYQDQEVEHYGL
ncbi:MAG: hypothetical protein E7374_01110 [Clostridiales bacterium]|nr:hypothetical protein [Clostridiales bacterium]